MRKLINKLLKEKTENRFITLFRYIVTGGFVTVINLILLYIFVEVFKINYIFSNIISMIICISITYFISKKIIFTKKVRIGVKKEFLSYIIIAVISIIVDTTILNVMTEMFNIYYIISKIIATGFSSFLNYFLKLKIYNLYKC